MLWVKIVTILLMAASVVALFRGLGAIVRNEGAQGHTARALAWRVSFSVLLLLFVLFSAWMGWIEPAASRY